jgi:hypothetical protein
MAGESALTWSKDPSEIPRWALDADPDNYQVEKLGISAYAAIERGAVLDEFDTQQDAQGIAERAYRARLTGGPGRQVTVRRWERVQVAGPDPRRELVFQVTAVLQAIDGTAVYLDCTTMTIESDRSGAHTAEDFAVVSLARIDLERSGWAPPLCWVTEVSPRIEEPVE